jgi:hypothetical protein
MGNEAPLFIPGIVSKAVKPLEWDRVPTFRSQRSVPVGRDQSFATSTVQPGGSPKFHRGPGHGQLGIGPHPSKTTGENDVPSISGAMNELCCVCKTGAQRVSIVSRTVVQSYFGTGGSQGDVGGVRCTCRTCESWGIEAVISEMTMSRDRVSPSMLSQSGRSHMGRCRAEGIPFAGVPRSTTCTM